MPAPEIAPLQALSTLPEDLIAKDVPNDAGRAIRISWTKPHKDDQAAKTSLDIWRKGPGDGTWQKIGTTLAGTGKFTDSYAPAGKNKKGHIVKDGVAYQYKVSIKDNPDNVSAVLTATSAGQWFNAERTSVAVATVVYVFLVLFFIWRARSGAKLYVRPIAGISAVEEAVGRATEMGKPVLYIPGIGEIHEVATLAALTILSPIAEKVAEYSTPIMVPNRDPVVFSVAQEVVREAYLKVGRPDEYREDTIFFLSGRQFAYAAAVSGIMMREKPATNFFFGMFYAESLILAETGAATGAIQIAGTDQVAQLPFFIAACDYTLIGEELYAASAYLSDNPILVGSLKALDWAKVIILAILFAGLGLSFFGITWLAKAI